MKKIILLILLVVLVYTGRIYFKEINNPQQKIVVHETAYKVVNDNQAPPSFKINSDSHNSAADNDKNPNNKVRKIKDQNFEAYDALEKSWLLKAQKIIGADKYAVYVDMKNQNEKEKLAAYKEFHNYLRKKYGDKFSYNISDDQSIREKEINHKYLAALAKLIGPEKFTEYTAAKDQLNEEMIRNNKDSIQVEF